METKREALRILVLQGRQLTSTGQERLERGLLAGPPRAMYREGIDAEEWKNIVEHTSWVRLAKLDASVTALGAIAAARLADLSRTHPKWHLEANESDEFSHWMSGTGDPDYEDRREVNIAPRRRRELVLWLKQPAPEHHLFYEDTWRDICSTRFFHALYALCDLATEGTWPVGRWREAFQVWSEEHRVSRAWRYAAPLVQRMPDTTLPELAHGVASWVSSASKPISRHEGILLDLCRRVLELPLDAGSGITRNGLPLNEPVTEAINHPVGHAAQALLNLWFKREPNDNDGLPADIETFFTQLCNLQVDRFRHGRVLLSSNLIALFRVDRPWTERHLLPIFDWKTNVAEANVVWEGFLWSPRLYRPLLVAFKIQFLETARHYSDLHEHAQQFAAFFTYAALEAIEGYETQEFRSAIAELPQEGLEQSAQALSQALEGAGDQREAYWKNRIQPFWQNIWPKSRDLATARIAESLVRMCIAAGSEFPAALSAIQDWLQTVEHPDYVVRRLRDAGHCHRFPRDAVRLLSAIIEDQQWGPLQFSECLHEIRQAAPELEHDVQYQRLSEYARRRGT